jgi:hypothetical protein
VVLEAARDLASPLELRPLLELLLDHLRSVVDYAGTAILVLDEAGECLCLVVVVDRDCYIPRKLAEDLRLVASPFFVFQIDAAVPFPVWRHDGVREEVRWDVSDRDRVSDEDLELRFRGGISWPGCLINRLPADLPVPMSARLVPVQIALRVVVEGDDARAMTVLAIRFGRSGPLRGAVAGSLFPLLNILINVIRIHKLGDPLLDSLRIETWLNEHNH